MCIYLFKMKCLDLLHLALIWKHSEHKVMLDWPQKNISHHTSFYVPDYRYVLSTSVNSKGIGNNFWSLLKRAHSISQHFFFIWTWELKHKKYVDIKQFSKQNNFYWNLNFYCYFVNQVFHLSMRSGLFARKLHCLHICLRNEACVLYNICVYKSLGYILFW